MVLSQPNFEVNFTLMCVCGLGMRYVLEKIVNFTMNFSLHNRANVLDEPIVTYIGEKGQ